MRTLFLSPKLRWVFLLILTLSPILVVFLSFSNTASLKDEFDQTSNDRVQQLEEAVEELQKQLVEEKDLEKDLTDTLKKYKKIIIKRSKAPAPALYEGKILDCQEIDRIKITQNIAQGYSKVVQEGQLGDKYYAVKSASYEVKNVKDCVNSGKYKKREDCFILGSYQVLKEAMMLRQLQHPNIVRLLGLCVRSENSSPLIHERGVTVVEELGTPVLLHVLGEMIFRSKVEVCLDLARLLHYLVDTPLGSVAITDWRDEQFVLVAGEMKLADVDGLNSKEPPCDKDMKCLINDLPSGLKCAQNMECPGTNAKTNLLHARTHFLQPLLGSGIPIEFFKHTSNLLQDLDKANLDAEDLVERLEDLMKFIDSYTQPPPLDIPKDYQY
ncbi:extracellular tyrosine-protein kinase PKDCC-like [Asterias amurensis]|uniref:extracellular tyrosine-protein kinase PKDCC-like n=1 Tax=Asterias amurensis TaxID=7602 RepID=UPI003AB818ED